MWLAQKLTKGIVPKKFFAFASIALILTVTCCQAAHAQNSVNSNEKITIEEVVDPNPYFKGSKPEEVMAVDMLAEVPELEDFEEASSSETEENWNENFLLLKVTSSKTVLNQGLSSYQSGGRLYLSLFELMDTLYFPIEVFDEEQNAKGWFIEEDNDFYLDMKQESLIIKGRNVEYSDKDVILIDEEIYVSSTALKDWFGIDSDLNFSRQTLDIESTEQLQFEEKIERQERWRKQKSNKKAEIAIYEELELPYKMAEIPSSTVILSSNYSDTQGQKTSAGGYTVQGSGDLLGMSSEFFISGSDEEKINDSRIKFYRYDEKGVIAGTDIKQVEVGDISPARLNLAGSGGTERGLKFTNKSEGEITSLDNLLIEGEVEPGWEVELYRNNEFIAFVGDTSSGRYEFSGLTLEGGLNLFRIVKYGPFGEVEEEFRRYFIGGGLLKKGETKYEVSASQVDSALLPTTAGGYDIGGNQRIVASADYGVTDDFSIGTGLYSGPILEEQRNAALLSSRASILGTYNVLDYLANDDSTSIAAFSNRMNFADFNISSFATYYNGFDQTEIDTLLDSNIDVSTNINIFDLTSVNLRVGAEYETFQSGAVRHGYNNQISTIVQGFVLSNKLNWDVIESAGNKNYMTTGEFFFRKRIDDFIFNEGRDISMVTNVLYKLDPQASIDSLNLTLEQNIFDETRLNLGVTQAYGQIENTTYNVGINQTHDYFLVGAGASYDSQGDMRVGLNLRFNIGADYSDGANGDFGFIKNEQAQRGSVEALVFLDNNNNGKFDNGDEPLNDVVLKSRFGITGKTNNNGTAYLSGFAGYKADDITLDYNSLPDIFYVPINDGYKVTPRPGHKSHIEFPVVVGGEIDGQIQLNSEQQNNSYDFTAFTLELVNNNGDVVKETQADQTGYYIFDRVIPADYILRIKQEDIANTGYAGQTEKKIKFDMQDPVITDLNFVGDLPQEITDTARVQQ